MLAVFSGWFRRPLVVGEEPVGFDRRPDLAPHVVQVIGYTKRLRSIDCGLVERVAMAPEQGIGGHIDGEADHGRFETGIGVMLVFHGVDQGRGESPAPKDEAADFGMVRGDQFEFEFTGWNPGSAQRSG